MIVNLHAPGKVGDTVHYVPPIEGATGGAKCREAVIMALGKPPHDDIFADLTAQDGDPLVASRVMIRIGFGYWGDDQFAGHLGNTWHPVIRCGVHPEPAVHVELTDEGGGKLTLGGHLLPYESVAVQHDPAGLPRLTVSLPLVHGFEFAADGWAKVGDETRQALIAMGWTPPASDAAPR